MLGTGPGIFSFFSRFPQVSRWGSRAPSCFDLWGEFFSFKKVKEKIPCCIFALLLLSPMLFCGGIWRERKKKKINFCFFSSKGLAIFPETGCWKHFITKVYWPEICSYLHQGESVAIRLRSLGVHRQAAPLSSLTKPTSSAGPAMVQAPCQVTEWV